MNRLICGAASLGLALLCSVMLCAAAPQDKPAQAKDAPAPEAASIEGQWHLTMPRMGGMAPISILDIKLDGKKLKGSITSPSMGELPIKGEFSNNKIKFSLELDLGTQNLAVDFEGKLKDGELSGTVIIGPMGEVEWKATRARGH